MNDTPAELVLEDRQCPACHGRGKHIDDFRGSGPTTTECPYCRGTGRVTRRYSILGMTVEPFGEEL